MFRQTEKTLTYFLKVERVSAPLPVVSRLTMTKDAIETQENKFTKMFSQDIPKRVKDQVIRLLSSSDFLREKGGGFGHSSSQKS